MLVWLVTAYWLHVRLSQPTNRVLRSCDQPAAVNYPSGRRYVLYALEGSRNPEHSGVFGRFVGFDDDRRLILVVVPRGTPPAGYWHRIELDPPVERGSETLKEYVSRCKVEWTPEGVTFRDGSMAVTITIEHVFRDP